MLDGYKIRQREELHESIIKAMTALRDLRKLFEGREYSSMKSSLKEIAGEAMCLTCNLEQQAQKALGGL